MNSKEIKVSEINYKGITYIKKLKTNKDEMCYEYYYLENGMEKKLEDENILKYLRSIYESSEGDTVYDI